MPDPIISPDGKYMWIENNWVELPNSIETSETNDQTITITDSVVKGNLTQIINDSESMELVAFTARAHEIMVRLEQAVEARNHPSFTQELDGIMKLAKNSTYANIFAKLFDYDITKKIESYYYSFAMESLTQGPSLRKIIREGNYQLWKKTVYDNLRRINHCKTNLLDLSKISGENIRSLQKREICFWAVTEKFNILHDAIEYTNFELNLVDSLNIFRNSGRKQDLLKLCVTEFKQILRNFSAEFGNFGDLGPDDYIRQSFDEMLSQLKKSGNVSRNKATFMVACGILSASFVVVISMNAANGFNLAHALISYLPLNYFYRAKMFIDYRKLVT